MSAERTRANAPTHRVPMTQRVQPTHRAQMTHRVQKLGIGERPSPSLKADNVSTFGRLPSRRTAHFSGWLCCLFFTSFVTLVSQSAHGEKPVAEVAKLDPIAASKAKAEDARQTLRVAALDKQFKQLAKEVEHLERHYAILNLAAKVTRPSVVHIEAEKKSNDPAHRIPDGGIAYVEEAGSGVIATIGDKVYIITNRHVVSGAELTGINLELANGRALTPIAKWTDPATDVAVISIEDRDLLPARIGSSEKVSVGDPVLAFGSPFGLNHSVTQGIISAMGRRDLLLGEQTVEIQDFMQTDAAINPGNSGGPLFNLRGELIGINTAIASNSGGNEGIGFSIPIDLAMTVAKQLVENGKMVRGYLGVKLNSQFTRSEAKELGNNFRQLGAHVTRASIGSPAETAGIEPDDVIVEFGATAVEDDGHLVNLVGLTPVDSVVPVRLIRDGEEMTLDVELSPRDH